jgi:hypothetical protein
MHKNGEVTQEVLEVGPSKRRTVRPRVIWAVGLVYLVVFSILATTGLVLFVGRTVQAERLIAAVEMSESAMVGVQADVTVVFAQFEEEGLTEDRRQELIAELRAIAERGEASIAEAGAKVAAVRIWPVNERLARAQVAYLAHNFAWQEYLARAAEDPAEFVSPQPEVNDTFFEARDPLWQAVPGIDLLDLERRLRVIYAGSENGEGTAA